MLNQLEQVADMADGVRGQRGALVLLRTGYPRARHLGSEAALS